MFDLTSGSSFPEALLWDEGVEGDAKRNPKYEQAVKRAIKYFALFIKGLMIRANDDLHEEDLVREYY